MDTCISKASKARIRSYRLDLIVNVLRITNFGFRADSLQSLQLKFDTKEQAMLFAAKNGKQRRTMVTTVGFSFFVQFPQPSTAKDSEQTPSAKKTYASNFAYSPDKLKIIKTK